MLKDEIKKNIINKVQSVEDDLLLDEIYQILNVGTAESQKFLFTDRQKAILDSRIKEIENGEFISDEEATKDLDEWLKK